MALDDESVILAAAERILADLCDLQEMTRAGEGAWRARLWPALEANGLTLAMSPESAGGPGLDLVEALALLRLAGRFAMPAPLAETMLARWALAGAGLAAPDDGVLIPVAAFPADPLPASAPRIDAGGRIAGRVRGVAFASDAALLAVLCTGPEGPVLATVDPAAARIEPARSLAFDPFDRVVFDGAPALSHAPAGPAAALPFLGAVARAEMTAGALERLLEMTLRYAGERVAFERKIGKFQAVQHLLAQLGEEAAAAVAAAGSASEALASGADGLDRLLEVGAARIRCAEAAEKATDIAHQVHGAIGYTAEHPLHRLTLRALAWREDFGTETDWSVAIGRAVAARGADALWPLLAGR